jgi:hypothetical protein
LIKILRRAGYDTNSRAIKYLTKYCHQYQINTKSPSRFKFNIRDNDYEFNFSIVIDIIYLNNKLILQVMDVFTSFQTTSFLKDISARTT